MEKIHVISMIFTFHRRGVLRQAAKLKGSICYLAKLSVFEYTNAFISGNY